MTTPITPLDPNSPRGQETTERLSQVFAEIRLAIAERKQRAARKKAA